MLMTDDQDQTSPAFLGALTQDIPEDNSSATTLQPGGMSWDDRVLGGGGQLTAAYRKIAKLMQAEHTPESIAQIMAMDIDKLKELYAHQGIQDEISRITDLEHAEDPATRIKAMGHDAANVIEDILKDKDVAPLKKVDHAKWVLEKIDGKAAQKVDIQGGINIGIFMDKLDQIASKPGAVIETKPERVVSGDNSVEDVEELPQRDKLADWLDSNLD